MTVEPLIEIKKEAVHRLQRIVRQLRFLIVARRAASQTQAQQQR